MTTGYLSPDAAGGSTSASATAGITVCLSGLGEYLCSLISGERDAKAEEGLGTHENSLARRGEAPKKEAYASSHRCCGCGSHGIVYLDGEEEEVG